MKNLFISLLLVSFTQAAMAEKKMVCDVMIAADGADKVFQTYELIRSEDPHGALTEAKLDQFGGVTILLGVLPDDTAVMSVYHEKTEVGSSSKAKISGMQIAHHQIILPSPGVGTNSIEIDCQHAAE